MGRFIFFLLSAFVLFGAAAHGQEPYPIPDIDPLAQLLMLVRDWQAMGPLAFGMGCVVLLTQILKRFVGDGFKYKRLAVTLLSVVYGVFLSVQAGTTWLEALVAVFVTGGGAVAIYEAWKGVSRMVFGAKAPGLELPK